MQEVISRFLTWPQLVGTLGSNMFRKLVPDFLTCPQLVGTWVQNTFRNFCPVFSDMPSASGYRGANDVQELGPRCLACHVPNVACHGVSISIVSISSMSCRIRILRASVSMPCRVINFIIVAIVIAPVLLLLQCWVCCP